MEVNTTTTTVPSGPPTRNHSYTQHRLHSERHSHNHSHGHFPSKTILIIIAFVTLVTVLFIIFVVLFLIRRQKSSSKNGTCEEDSRELHDTSSRLITSTTLNSSPDVKSGCLHGGNLSRTPAPKFRGVQVFTYRELEIATDGFSEANVIGSNGIIGGHGLIYRGVLSDGTLAAIKLLRTEGKQGERAFRIEVDLLSRLHSPHLVELLGYCADQHHRLLIFEYMPNGTLHYHLHTPNDQYQLLDWWARMRIALDCARALEFLHEHAVSPVIHRDFKSNNVLLDQNFRAKVSDFGLAKMGSEKRNGRVLGTTGYLAPEYATGKLTTKSDVYSYGVVLLELLTGRVPVDIKRAPGEHVLVSWALPRLTNREKVIEMVDPALRGQYSKKDLIQPEADYRPLMTDVVQSLIPLVRNQSSLSSSSSLRFQKQTPSPTH
ncbi:hypothetical protein AAZV13_10G124700 [Glycine max]